MRNPGETGKTTRHDRYAILGLHHPAPSESLLRPDPIRRPVGGFEIQGYKVYLSGSSSALPEVRQRDISPEGDFAVSHGGKSVLLWRAGTAQPLVIWPKWAWAAAWDALPFF